MDTYEKKYKEALERARKIYDEIVNNEVIGFPGQITEIFPELRESEDERIRKEIVFIVKQYGRICEKEGDPCCTINDCLAYLEKQKEQKPEIEICPHSIKSKSYSMQKPDSLTKYVYSKEDKKFIQDCANILVANDYATSAERLLSMFEQKPAEWSEEDEKMLNDCIMALSNWRDAVANYGHEVAPCQELIDWLKSIRPSWKPSKEQMEHLKAIVEEYSWMEPLYNDLLKLK